MTTPMLRYARHIMLDLNYASNYCFDMLRAATDLEGSRATRNTPSDLLNAASALLTERNGGDISIKEIAIRAQANSALISYHFGSKDGLMMALLERDMTGGLLQLEKLVALPMPPAEKMRIHISGVINLYHRFPYLNQLLLRVAEGGSPEQSKAVAEKLVSPMISAQAKIIEEGKSLGQFKAVDPMFFYYTLLGACDRIYSARYTLSTVFGVSKVSDDMKKRLIEHTTEIIMGGLLKRTVET